MKIKIWKMKIKIWKVLWLGLVNRQFRRLLKDSIEYALNNYNQVRGDGSSDVLWMVSKYGDKFLGYSWLDQWMQRRKR